MSAKIMGLAWDLNLPRAEMFVLQAYADHADHNGENCFPGIELIAWKTGYTMKQVSKIVAALEDRGILEVVERGTGRNNFTQYRIRLEKGEKKPPFSKGAVRAAEKGKGEKSSPISNEGENPKGGNSGSERGNFSAVKGEVSDPPIRKNRRTNSNRQSGAPPAAPKEDPIFEAVAEVCGIDWRQPMTDDQRGRINKAAKQLRTIETTPEEIRRRAAAYRKKWPDTELTPQALTGNWSQCMADPKRAAAASAPPVDQETLEARELESDAMSLWRLMMEPEDLRRRHDEPTREWHARVKGAWQKQYGFKGRSHENA